MTRTLQRQTTTVPPAIIETLRRVMRRTRLVITLRGTAATVATGLVALLVIMAVDRWVVIFASWPRWLLTLSAGAATAAALVWFLLHPLARSFTLPGIARAIEKRHPELQERISSTVELLSSPDAPELRGSEALIHALADEAEIEVKAVRASREVTLRAAMPFLTAAGAVVAVLLGLVVAWPEGTWRQLRRSLLPSLNTPRVAGYQIRAEPAGDGIRPVDASSRHYALLRGARLRVPAEVDNEAVRSAEIIFARDPDDEWTTLPMSPAGGRDAPRFSYVGVPFPDGTYYYLVRAGDAGTAWYRITVVPPPAIEETAVRFTYPDYMHRPPETVVIRPGATLSTWRDTRVTVTARANKPLEAVEATLNDARIELDATGGNTYRFARHLTDATDRRWRLRLRDRHGFTAASPVTVLRVRPDAQPKIQLRLADGDPLEEDAEGVLRVQPGDKVPFVYTVTDAVGLRRVRLTAAVPGRAEPIRLSERSFAASQRVRERGGQYVLNLSAPGLADAARVTMEVRAADTKTPDAETGRQANEEAVARYTVLVDTDVEDTYAERIADSEELRLRELLREILQHLNEARGHSRRLVKRMPEVAAPSAKLPGDVTRRVDALTDALGAARQRSVEAAAMPLILETYTVVSERLTAVARDHVARAAALGSQILLTDAKNARATLAEDADFKVKKAVEEVRDILEKLQQLVETVAQVRELADLDSQQDWLAEQLERMDGAARSGSRDGGEARADWTEDDWKRMQRALSGRLGEMVRQRPEALAAAQEQQGEKTRDLAAEAEQLRRREQKLAERTARIEALRANRPSDAEPSKAAEEPAEQPDGAGEQPDRPTDERRKILAEQRRQLQHDQRELAERVSDFADRLAEQAPQPDRAPLHAARAADEAAEALQTGDAAQAAAGARRAMEKLAQLAGSPAQRRPDSPRSATDANGASPRGLTPEMRDETRALHVRQRALNEQIRALFEADTAGVAASRQRALAEETGRLSQAVHLVRDQAKGLGLSDAAQKQAQAAATHAAQAEQLTAAAAEQTARLAGAESDATAEPASTTQRQAAQALGRVADALSQLGKALNQSQANAPEREEETSPLIEPGQLADAFEQAATASRTALPSDAQQAASLLSQLAARAARSARSMGLQVPVPGSDRGGHPGQATGRRGTSAQPPDAGRLPLLRRSGGADADWARIHGELDEDVRRGRDAARGPRAYRDLNRAYFETLAEQNGDDRSED